MKPKRPVRAGSPEADKRRQNLERALRANLKRRKEGEADWKNTAKTQNAPKPADAKRPSSSG